jgi:predicted ribosome quality control (RQC) complex YloA/Tae2 family protein
LWQHGSGATQAAEKKARREIKDVGVKAAIQKVRKAYWFEKFHWFISSEVHDTRHTTPHGALGLC